MAPATIDRFDGEFRWLSNFSEHPVLIAGDVFRTAEHAFQALKTLDSAERVQVRSQTTPGRAKRVGRRVTLRAGWEEGLKVDAMRAVVQAKFDQNPDIARKLIATGDTELVEGNHWGDRFWGVCDGQGENWLGRILMETRAVLIGAAELRSVEEAAHGS